MAASRVVGMEHSILDQLTDVFIPDPVEHTRTVPPRADEARHPELGQVLRYRCRRFTDGMRQIVDCQLVIEERPEQPDTRGVRQHAEHFDSEVDLILGHGSGRIMHIC